MKKIVVVGAILASLAMSGCSSQQPPSQAQISSASYGELPKDYQEKIKNHFNSTLKDPYSAQYKFMPTFKGYSQDGQWSPSGGKVTFGWVSPVLVNAKNSYGGYTGDQKYVFIFSGGEMYDVTAMSQFGMVHPVK
ncbi:hypothetical protein [Serratia nevei]|uniref:hypothetical protein n=1 Tax=Serratia nevei TaxID=2703794 RepID=UPI003FA787E1